MILRRNLLRFKRKFHKVHQVFERNAHITLSLGRFERARNRLSLWYCDRVVPMRFLDFVELTPQTKSDEILVHNRKAKVWTRVVRVANYSSTQHFSHYCHSFE